MLNRTLAACSTAHIIMHFIHCRLFSVLLSTFEEDILRSNDRDISNVLSSCNALQLFVHFNKFLQREDSIICVILKELKSFLRKLLGRFVKIGII